MNFKRPTIILIRNTLSGCFKVKKLPQQCEGSFQIVPLNIKTSHRKIKTFYIKTIANKPIDKIVSICTHWYQAHSSRYCLVCNTLYTRHLP